MVFCDYTPHNLTLIGAHSSYFNPEKKSGSAFRPALQKFFRGIAMLVERAGCTIRLCEHKSDSADRIYFSCRFNRAEPSEEEQTRAKTLIKQAVEDAMGTEQNLLVKI